MLHCSNSLWAILEKLPSSSFEQRRNTITCCESPSLVSVIDGMVELQSLDKPAAVKSCANLADHFIARIEEKYGSADEMRLMFDRYDILSLKEATRVKRLGWQDPIYNRVTNTTRIAKVPMKKLLSHSKSKMELTNELSEKVFEHLHWLMFWKNRETSTNTRCTASSNIPCPLPDHDMEQWHCFKSRNTISSKPWLGKERWSVVPSYDTATTSTISSYWVSKRQLQEAVCFQSMPLPPGKASVYRTLCLLWSGWALPEWS